MTTIIVGSQALKHHFPESREPKDYDIFTDATVAPSEDTMTTVFGEPLRTEPFWDDRLYGFFDSNDVRYATPDELYTIKLSHIFWELANGSWEKHICDILFLQDRGAEVIEPLYRILYGIWKDKHGSKKMSLKMSAGQFFTDAVTRIYDHDSIHRSVAYNPGKPLYEEVLKDGEEIDIDPVKLWAQPHEWLVKLFKEEVYATALERIVVPARYHRRRYSAGAAYHWALRRTITSLTTGRSARFIVENFREFIHHDDYVARHITGERWLEKL